MQMNSYQHTSKSVDILPVIACSHTALLLGGTTVQRTSGSWKSIHLTISALCSLAAAKRARAMSVVFVQLYSSLLY